MKTKTLAAITLLWVLLTVNLLVVSAAPLHVQEGPDALTLSAILLWIATGPGAAWLVGLLMTQVLENLPWWHAFPPQIKFVLSIVLVGGLPILAQLLLGWPGLALIEPWVNMAIMAIVAWLGSQYMYRSLKRQADPAFMYGVRKG